MGFLKKVAYPEKHDEWRKGDFTGEFLEA